MNASKASKRVRVQKKRDFEPQHLLLHIAEIALEDAQKKVPGWKNQERLEAINPLRLIGMPATSQFKVEVLNPAIHRLG